jgi:ribosomal protein S18 acetylase RimI-like enzyme
MSEPRAAARVSGAGVRVAVKGDTEALAQMMARAFHDDPVMTHFLPHQDERAKRVPHIFRTFFRLAQPFGACFVTDGIEAASIWRPPGKWQFALVDYVTSMPALLAAFGANVFRVMAAIEHVEKHHPKEPHWYLQAIGTEPDRQGKGFGSLVMREQLQKIDAERLPAYLESSKEKNIPIYQSFGFELTGEVRIPSGPPVWSMWRKARYV